MPILNSIEIVTTDIWEELERDYLPDDSSGKSKRLIIIPAKDNLEKIRDQMKEEEPYFNLVWKYMKAYLSFPYQQMLADDTTHIESQIIDRIGTIYSILGTARNLEIVDFLKREINSFLELFRESGGGEALNDFLKPLLKEEIIDRIFLKEEYDDYLQSLGYESATDEDGNRLTYLLLKPATLIDPSPNPHIFNFSDTIREKMVTRNRFLLLYELGVFECLKKHWKRRNVSSDQLGESELDYNETEFSKMMTEIFEFPVADTFRSDYNALKNYPDKIYRQAKQNEIKERINSYGFEKKS